MTDRLQEIRARMDDSAPVTITGPTPLVEAFQQKDADIAWLLAEVERLRDFQQRNNPWWRRDADGSLWAAPPTTEGAPEPDSNKWVRVQ